MSSSRVTVSRCPSFDESFARRSAANRFVLVATDAENESRFTAMSTCQVAMLWRLAFHRRRTAEIARRRKRSRPYRGRWMTLEKSILRGQLLFHRAMTLTFSDNCLHGCVRRLRRKPFCATDAPPRRRRNCTSLHFTLASIPLLAELVERISCFFPRCHVWHP